MMMARDPPSRIQPSDRFGWLFERLFVVQQDQIFLCTYACHIL